MCLSNETRVHSAAGTLQPLRSGVTSIIYCVYNIILQYNVVDLKHIRLIGRSRSGIAPVAVSPWPPMKSGPIYACIRHHTQHTRVCACVCINIVYMCSVSGRARFLIKSF